MASNPSHGNTEYPDFPSSYIPAVLPAGVDPSTVDFREFYPYIPNEVKHRKRTTQAQLELLEDTFSRDKKPNGVLRATLARELDMTPRGVQVWFQNRRAKEKNLAKKAASMKHRNEVNLNPNLNRSNPAISPSDGDKGPDNSKPAPNGAGPVVRSGSVPVPQTTSIPSVRYGAPLDPHTPAHLNADPMFNYRRGSLPIITRSTSEYTPHTYRQLQSHDLLARRSSFDTNIVRLAQHPYAHLAAQANVSVGRGSPRLYPGAKSNSLPNGPDEQIYARAPHIDERRTPSYRASMPYILSNGPPAMANSGVDSTLIGLPRFTSRYHDGMYAMPSRVISTLIPGPLPAPNFSFGDSSSPPAAPSPDLGETPDHYLNNYAFPSVANEHDEDDATSSFDAISSRFGSIASLAGSESSMTSYYSETGSCVAERHEYPPDFHPDSRRPSHVMIDHFSSLGLENQQESLLTHPSPDEVGNNSGNDSPGASTTYPSPGSTISSGSSPQPSSGDGRLRISSSSELALALSPTSAAETSASQERPEGEIYNESSPMLDSRHIANSSRACYDPDYRSASYPIYDEQGRYDLKHGRYDVPPYGENHSPDHLDPLNPSPGLYQDTSPPSTKEFTQYNSHPTC